MNELQIQLLQDSTMAAGLRVFERARYRVNKRTGIVQVPTARGMWVNSVLSKDEYEQLDTRSVMEATKRLNGVSHLAGRGLTHQLGGIGSIISQYNQVSEMDTANVAIEMSSKGGQDLVDRLLVSVPVPVIFKPYSFGNRTLDASRRTGDQLSTDNAGAAARVVAESLESMYFLGNTTITVNGAVIYGLTTHPSRKTSSGSDWGTVGNAITDVGTMINGLQASGNGHYGPYFLYASTNQYNQLYNVFYTDGSGDNQADRIMRMAGIEAIHPSDWLTDGQAVLVQMTPDVVDLAFVPGFGFGTPGQNGIGPVSGVSTLEWVSGDGSTFYFMALTIAVPRVKSTYAGRSGIYHISGI